MKFLSVSVDMYIKLRLKIQVYYIHLMCSVQAYTQTHVYSDVVNQKLMFINNKFDMKEIFVIQNVWGAFS